jgi:hypothetical protein
MVIWTESLPKSATYKDLQERASDTVAILRLGAHSGARPRPPSP